ncbi:MAG TPA: LysR family transcriptional regulator [Rhodocyclaceae bacterium]
MKNVTLRQQRVFEAVARNLSFSRAAEEMHLTQPAVSMQVRALEEQVDLPLFEHIGKKIRLTAAGEELLRHARRIDRQIQDAGEALAALRGATGGRLTIGVVSTAKYFAPKLIIAFLRTHPDADLRLVVRNRDTIVRQLGDNEIDLAIMGSPPSDFETVAEAFADHPLSIIANPEHPLAKVRTVRPEELAAERFLIRELGSGTRSTMERYFEAAGVALQKTIEMESNETVKQAVMAGMGLGFISEHAISLELATQQVVRLNVTGTPVMRRWYVVHRPEKRLLPIADAFLDFIRADAAALMAGAGTG